MARKRRRLSAFIGRYLPWAVLTFCAANWLWSVRGSWWVELSSEGYTLTARRNGVVVAGYVSNSVRRGIYSYDGCLFLSLNLEGRITRCLPSVRQVVFDNTVKEFWTRGADVGLMSSFHGEEVWPDPWEPYHYLRGGRVAGLGFALLWNEEKGCVFPWWFLCAVFAVTPTKQCLRAWKFRKLRRRGLCPSCGYDLRATPERCPECGRLTPARPAAAVLVS